MPKKFQVRVSEVKMEQAVLPDKVTTRSVAVLQPGSKTATVEVSDATTTLGALALVVKALGKGAAPRATRARPILRSVILFALGVALCGVAVPAHAQSGACRRDPFGDVTRCDYDDGTSSTYRRDPFGDTIRREDSDGGGATIRRDPFGDGYRIEEDRPYGRQRDRYRPRR